MTQTENPLILSLLSHVPIMKMLSKILPNGVCYTFLFLQYNNSCKLFINPVSDLALNAIMSHMTSIPPKEWPGHSDSAPAPMPMFLDKMARNVFAIIENSSMIR